MAFYNVDEHGVSSGVSVNEKGMPSSPFPSPVQTHGRVGQLQSCSLVPIISEQRQPTKALNGTSMRIDAADGLVGSSSKADTVSTGGVEEHAGRSNHINDKNCLGGCKKRDGSFFSVPGLSGLGQIGEVDHCVLGQRCVEGPMFMMEENRAFATSEVARERTTIPGVGTHEPVIPRPKMEANRWSCAEVVRNGKPEGVGPTTPSVFQTHQDLGTPLVCVISNQEVNGQRFVVQVNEAISGESLYFPGEDCKPIWQSSYVGGHGSSSSAKGAGVLGEASEFGRVNISNPSKILAIGISTGREGACGNISTEKCTREARRNDDTGVNSLRVDVDRGGQSRESEGLVEREELVGAQELINAGVDSLTHIGTNMRNVQSANTVSPSLLPRELDGSLAGLGRGPGC
ncbi:hypothetical protein Ancab_018452 [Ancistrocladus abbreviatus]